MFSGRKRGIAHPPQILRFAAQRLQSPSEFSAKQNASSGRGTGCDIPCAVAFSALIASQSRSQNLSPHPVVYRVSGSTVGTLVLLAEPGPCCSLQTYQE
jgi:hypothetical protein